MLVIPLLPMDLSIVLSLPLHCHYYISINNPQNGILAIWGKHRAYVVWEITCFSSTVHSLGERCISVCLAGGSLQVFHRVALAAYPLAADASNLWNVPSRCCVFGQLCEPCQCHVQMIQAISLVIFQQEKQLCQNRLIRLRAMKKTNCLSPNLLRFPCIFKLSIAECLMVRDRMDLLLV